MSFTTFNVTASTVYDAMYPGIDFSSLNWFEQQWAAWYVWWGNPTVATGLLTFFVHEITYFGRCLPWVMMDAIPYFHRWKLQPKKIPSPQEQWECTKLVLFSHFTSELPAIWFFHPVADALGLQTYQVPFPTLKVMTLQILLFFVLEDLYHFVAHQMLHWPLLYKHIHKLHHKHSAPFGLAAEFAHPAEVAILAIGTIGAPLLYCYLRPDLHLMTVQIWIVLRLFQAIDAHSGYDLPWSLRHFIPFWSGAEHHDFHHMAFTNNFSTSFRWWDRIFGTDKKYLEYRARIAAHKKAMKGASKEEMLVIEEKLNAEVEAEGLRAEAEVEGRASKTTKVQ